RRSSSPSVAGASRSRTDPGGDPAASLGGCHPDRAMRREPLAGIVGRDRIARRRSAGMCRWMGWIGQPVLIEELVFKTQHGIVDQSLHSKLGAETTNGDGFGLGWYGT